MSAKRFNSHIDGLQNDTDLGVDNAFIDLILATTPDASNSQPFGTSLLSSAVLDGLSFDAGTHGSGGSGGGGGGKPGGGGSLPTTYTSGSSNVDDSQEFNIQIHFSGSWTAAQQADVIDAANAWSRIITADIHDDLDLNGKLVDDIVIDLSIGRIDGSGSIITGVNTLATTSNVVVRDATEQDPWLPLTASIKLDATDLKNPDLAGLWPAIIMHEMGHALGFAGPIFQQLGLVDGAHNFIGTNAVSAYGGVVPLTTDDSHWSETSFAPKGVSQSGDLMTTLFALGQQTVLSDTTVQAFADLGYHVTDPSPGSDTLFLDNLWLV
jgi:hypothetical protein